MDDTLKECPFCGGEGKLIHPMGEYLANGPPHYGPNGSRIVCRSLPSVCCAMTPAFYGPDHEAEAIAAWNARKSPRTDGWQDIASAPISWEISVDLWVVDRAGGRRITDCRASLRNSKPHWFCECPEMGDREIAGTPTHWRPLPAPPALRTGEATDV